MKRKPVLQTDRRNAYSSNEWSKQKPRSFCHASSKSSSASSQLSLCNALAGQSVRTEPAELHWHTIRDQSPQNGKGWPRPLPVQWLCVLLAHAIQYFILYFRFPYSFLVRILRVLSGEKQSDSASSKDALKGGVWSSFTRSLPNGLLSLYIIGHRPSQEDGGWIVGGMFWPVAVWWWPQTRCFVSGGGLRCPAEQMPLNISTPKPHKKKTARQLCVQSRWRPAVCGRG